MTHFTDEQLQELATIFGLKKVEDLLPVRDGFVTKETMVWWRCMRRTNQELRFIGKVLSEFQTRTQDDLDDLADDLNTNKWAQLTQAADASLAHIIFKNMSAAQKEVLISLLSE